MLADMSKVQDERQRAHVVTGLCYKMAAGLPEPTLRGGLGSLESPSCGAVSLLLTPPWCAKWKALVAFTRQAWRRVLSSSAPGGM